MKHYIEAYRGPGDQILGNLDGQTVMRNPFWWRDKWLKNLRSGLDRPKWSRVSYWRVVDERGTEKMVINNPFWEG